MIRTIIMIVMAVASQLTMAFAYTIEISEQELQERVVAMMPLKQKVLFVTVTLTEPMVDLIKDNDEIGLQATIAVTAPGGVKGEGLVHLTGSIVYDSVKGAFYFHKPTIVRLDVKHVSEQYAANIKEIAQLIVSNAMSQYPVYKFKDDNTRHRMAKATLKSIAVENEQLLITLGMP